MTGPIDGNSCAVCCGPLPPRPANRPPRYTCSSPCAQRRLWRIRHQAPVGDVEYADWLSRQGCYRRTAAALREARKRAEREAAARRKAAKAEERRAAVRGKGRR